MSSYQGSLAPLAKDGEISDAELEAVAGGYDWSNPLLCNTSNGNRLLSGALAGYTETAGPAGAGAAAVGGAMATMDNDAECQRRGVNSQSVRHETGHQISRFFHRAFHGW